MCLAVVLNLPVAFAQPDLPVVTASAGLDHMRFTSTPSVAQIRVVASVNEGEAIFDSGWQGGNVFDWSLADSNGHKLAAGTYHVTVSVRDLDGHVMNRKARVAMMADQIAVETGRGDDAMVITVADDVRKVTVVAHDGKSGVVASTDGDLSFRTGDFFAGKDSEGMRLTSGGKVGIGTDHPTEKLDVHGSIKADGFILSDGTVISTTSGANSVTHTATRPPNSIGGAGATGNPFLAEVGQTLGMHPATHSVGPNVVFKIGGEADEAIAMSESKNFGFPGGSLTLSAASPSAATADMAGGDLILQSGAGNGAGAGGNVHLQTAAPAFNASPTTDNVVVDREIIVSKAKPMGLSNFGSANLFSVQLLGKNVAGGRIDYVIRATDAGSQVVAESGVIQYLATAGSVTCAVQPNDKVHLGIVNSGCITDFFNPGSQPGITLIDNVSFQTPASVVVHEVYYTIHNQSGSQIRLEP